MDNRNRHFAMTALLAGTLLLTPGCETTEEAGSETGLSAAAEAHPRFFVANEWVDADSSGGADYWEFEGANKWNFRSDENITFVSRIEAPIGAVVTWQLRAPDGAIVDQDESSQRWDSTWRRAFSGPVIDLLDVGGPGVWWVEWYVNGQRIGECAANLMR